jgi:hypothetical protein
MLAAVAGPVLVAATALADASPVRPFVRSGAEPAAWRLDQATLDALAQAPPGPILLEGVPLRPGRHADLTVERFRVTSAATRFVRSTGEPIDFDPESVLLLRGAVAGRPGSRAFLALSGRGALGIVQAAGETHAIAGAAGPDGVVRLHVEPAAPPGAWPWPRPCGVADGARAAPRGGAAGAASNPGPRQIELAIDSDYEFFDLFDDLGAAAAYVVSLSGAVSDLYQRDLGARIDLTFVRLWDTPDDLFNEPNPLVPFRDHWNANMTAVPRDAAQLLTGRRNLPYGGVAYGSALCGPFGYNVCGWLQAWSSAPGVSPHWDVVVTAHELAHNCGTGHTHDYGIDACDQGAVQRGTIMSYCHLGSGGLGNIDLRFHAVVQDVVRGYLAGSTCTVADCNGNGVDDDQDVLLGASPDVNANGIPDGCEDCNGNGQIDQDDIAARVSADLDGDGVPDECEPDCNRNGVPDDLDIAQGRSLDQYGDGVPDECEADCDGAAGSDYAQIQADMTLDADRDAALDACQDCDGDGVSDAELLAGALNLWVAGAGPGTGAGAVREFHATSGALVKAVETGQAGPCQDVRLGADGLLYVASAAPDVVARFDPLSGAFVDHFVTAGSGGLAFPAAIAFMPGQGDLLVSSRDNARVLRYDGVTGFFLGDFVAPGAGGLVAPHGLTFTPGGDLLVASDDDRVLRFDGATGALLGAFIGAGAGGLDAPRGLLFKPDGNLLVASSANDRVLEYDGASGAFVGRFDQGGPESGFYWFLNEPVGLALHPHGDQVLVSARAGYAAVHSFRIDGGLFLRSYYVVGADIVAPAGLAFAGPSPFDCNLNLVPDACDIAAGRARDADGDGVPDGCAPPACPADVNRDGVVGVQDLVAVTLAWGPCAARCAADVDGDGAVAVPDLVLVVLAWGPCPGP